MLDSTAASELVHHITGLADAGTTVVVCEHREEFLLSIPELRTVRLERQVIQEAAIPSLEPHLNQPQAQRLAVQGLTVALGGRLILRNLTFSAEMGQVVAVVGRNPENLVVAALAGAFGHFGKFLVKWGLATLAGAPVGLVALGLARAIGGHIIFGALGGLLGGLTLRALRRAGFFAYLAEKK